jgi:hypothetical protein
MYLREKYVRGGQRTWSYRRQRRSALNRCVAWLCVTIVLVPALPCFGPGNLAIGDIRGLHGRRERETSVIFTVLDAQDMKLNQTSRWHLARSIQEASEKHGFDPALVLAIIEVESRFNHRAVSPAGARGLMQVQPVAASAVAKEMDLPEENLVRTLEDPIINVKIGTAYLKHLKDMFDDLKLTLIAYNRGPTKLRQSLATKAAVPLTYANKVLLARHSLEANWGIDDSSRSGQVNRVSRAG